MDQQRFFGLEKLAWFLGIQFVFLLVACQRIETAEAPTDVPPTIIIAATKSPSLTPSQPPIPDTAILTPTATATPSPSLPPTFTPTPGLPVPAASAPDNLRLVYVYQGNLYLQEGSQPPLQLTFSGQDRSPIFSDDGQKIVFWRGQGADLQDLYAINPDGSGELALLTNEILLALGQERYNENTECLFRDMIPSTHQLLCRTHQLDRDKMKQFGGRGNPAGNRNFDLLLVDSDTGKIEVIYPPKKIGSFELSPDGNLITRYRSGQVDIADLSGRIVYHNVVTYTPTQPFEAFPDLYWLPDSSGLIALVPDESNEYYPDEGLPEYFVWRYALDGSPPVYVPLIPSPIGGDSHLVSPDRKWIFYAPSPDKVTSNRVPVYLGNLQNGDTQLYVSIGAPPYLDTWSPDSLHFIFQAGGGDGRSYSPPLYLWSVNEPPVLVAEGIFNGWVDASRYLYFTKGMLMMGEIGGEAQPIVTKIPRFMGSYLEFVLLDAESNEGD